MIVCAVKQDTIHPQAPTAADLARRLDSELVVVHVATPDLLGSGYPPATAGVAVPAAAALPYPVPGPSEEEDELLAQQRRRCREHIERLVAASGFTAAPVELEFAAAVADGLRRFVREHRAELLVVGSQKGGAVRAALMGSTTQDLVTDPPCPVVVVPRGDDARAGAASAR